MPSRVQIVVEATNATAGVFRALTSEMGSFGGLVEELTAKNISWGNVGQMAASMVVDGLKASITATTEYAAAVRDQMLISGQSAEQSSRFLQVLDDYQLSAEDAKAATRALTKEGLAPTVETIAQLSGEYLKLNTVEERNAFVQKNLGKAGQEWLNLLNQGPTAIMAMNDAVSDNLILTEENIRAAEEYRLALDNWGDGVEALKIKLGTALIPAMTGVVDEANNTVAAIEIMSEQGMEWWQILDHMAVNSSVYTDALKQAAAGTNELAVGTQNAIPAELALAEAEKAATEAAKLMSESNAQLLSSVKSFAGPLETWRSGVAEADAALANGSMTAAEHSAKIQQLGEDYQAASKKIILSMVEQNLARDGWTTNEMNGYFKVGQQMGIFTQEQVDMGRAAIYTADQIVRGIEPLNEMGESAVDAGNSLDHMRQLTHHVGERAKDAAVDFGIMGDAATGLGDRVADANGPVGGLKSNLNGMPPSGTVWNYLFNIETTGRVPNVRVGGGVGYQTDQHVRPGSGRQMGGEVFAGVPYTVGERGAEPFIPSRNGRILGHAESLHQLSMLGGGGQRNYFYGPVTLQVGQDGAAGLMSLR